MYKKLLSGVVFSILPFATAALAAHGNVAQTVAPQGQFTDSNKYFDGFYIGIGAGAGHNFTKSEVTTATNLGDSNDISIFGIPKVFTTNEAGNLNTDSTHKLGAFNFTGNGFLGYGRVVGAEQAIPFYIGGELFGKYNPTTFDSTDKGNITLSGKITLNADPKISESLLLNSNYNIDGKLQNDLSLGAAAKFGVLISPKSMFYVLFGMDYARFSYNGAVSIDGNISSTGINYHKLIPVITNVDFHSNKLGFMPGIGMETMLTNRLSLRAEYTYSYYGTINHNSDIDIAVINSRVATAAYKFSNLARGLFDLGLTYRFNGLN
jgi:opacity protein-like surface antigen